MGTDDLKGRLRASIPRPLWSMARGLHWSPPARYLRRLVARHEAARAPLSQLRTILLFIGYPRSGHSLVGSLLSAHRHCIVAHELHAMWYVEHGFSLDELAGLMIRRDRWFERNNRQWTEYNYAVPDQWQGATEEMVVLGDKKGDGVTDYVHRYPGLIQHVVAAADQRGLSVRIVHTVRNPFDNTATMVRRTGDPLEYVIERHTKRVALNQYLISTLPPGMVHTIRHEDLIAQPHQELRKLVAHVGLDAPDDYVDACSSILYAAPHRSRDTIPWPAAQRQRVDELIDRVPFLGGYSFER